MTKPMDITDIPTVAGKDFESISEELHVPTKLEWEENNRLMEETINSRKRTPKERAELEEKILSLNEESVSESLFRLIKSHPAEFELYVLDERRKRGIDDAVTSEFSTYIEKLLRKP